MKGAVHVRVVCMLGCFLSYSAGLLEDLSKALNQHPGIWDGVPKHTHTHTHTHTQCTPAQIRTHYWASL